MDVEKLQKINALANELKKHNFASNSNDAYEQAQEAFKMSEKEEKKAEVAPITPEKPVEQETKLDADFFEKKLQLVLEMNNKKYDKIIAEMQEGMQQMAQEIIKLRDRPVERVEKIEKQVQKELKTVPKESHPKRGEYTSSDVDIQKMFYFGNK